MNSLGFYFITEIAFLPPKTMKCDGKVILGKTKLWTFRAPPKFLLQVLSFTETCLFTGLLKCISISEAV